MEQPPVDDRSRRARSRLALGAALALALACGDPAAEARDAALTAARDSLAAGDASDALLTAGRALKEHGADPRLRLAAAEACLALERFDEASDHADEGLVGGDADATTRVDLEWAKGKAHLALFLQLRADDHWRTANSALERGTGSAGTRRADAAYALVRMQGLDGMGGDARREKFGRLFLQLEPDGDRADTVRELLGEGGR